MIEPVVKPPHYRIPIYRLLQALYFILRNRPRNLGRDFRFVQPKLPAAPLIRGTDTIPESGAFVLVANHYERPGLWMGWSGMATARAVFERTGRRLRWLAIAEWSDYCVGPFRVPPAITRWIFARFFHVFGFIGMESESASPRARAEGVRRAVDAIRSGDAIGIFPEGDIGETPAMIPAQSGSGSFMLSLAARGAELIPVGLFERDGRLQVSFGEPIDLSSASDWPRHERDTLALETVMSAVARLLPADLRGVYARD